MNARGSEYEVRLCALREGWMDGVVDWRASEDGWTAEEIFYMTFIVA